MAEEHLLKGTSALTNAEEEVLKNCKDGRETVIGLDKPECATAENEIRAAFIRELLLNPEGRVHESGLLIRGAWVTGQLDLRAVTVPRPLSLSNCVFVQTLSFNDATFSSFLMLKGSIIPGLNASRTMIGGSLSLESAKLEKAVTLRTSRVMGQVNCRYVSSEKQFQFQANGLICNGGMSFFQAMLPAAEINMRGAQIGGELSFSGLHIKSFRENVIAADRIHVRGSVLLSDGFEAVGKVRLAGARIDNQLNCTGATFRVDAGDALNVRGIKVSSSFLLGGGTQVVGAVHMDDARIEGGVSLRGGGAIQTFVADRATIKGELVLRNLSVPVGSISLVGTWVQSLNDDATSWGDHIFLNGFIYDLIDVHSSLSVKERLEWLDKAKLPIKDRNEASHFRPQPWFQLRKVLEEMGHAEESREIGIAYEQRLNKLGLVGKPPEGWSYLKRFIYQWLNSTFHKGYGVLTGYGYRPMFLLGWFIGVWLTCTVIYWGAANQYAVFAPSNPLIFQNPAYAGCRPPTTPNATKADGTGNWYLCAALPEEYTGFSPMAFSLDLLLPLVDLHQENDWAPLISTPKANVGAELVGFFSVKRVVRFIMWLEILAGWVFSLLFVAIVSGLARRKE